MKILKYLFFLILIFIIAASIFVATKEGSYKVEKEIFIEAPKEYLFSQVNDYGNWQKWGPWTSGEEAKMSSSGKNSGEGANISWRNNEKGDGSITTTEIVPNEKIVQKIKLDHNFGTSEGSLIWNFSEVKNGTLVSLEIIGEMDFKEKMHWEWNSNSVKDFFDPLLSESLSEYKTAIDEQMMAYRIKVHGKTEYGGGYFIYSSISAKQQNVQAKFNEIYPQINSFMNTNNISDNGSPFILYHDWNDENGTALFSICIPTPTKVVTAFDSNFLSGFMPAQTVVRTTLKGSRKNLPAAWDATFKYIQENGLELKPNFQPFEVYINTEAEEKVPANLITEIYIPVESTAPSEGF
ncbi:MAG TPA: GyrI-like domain-containing protein [Salinimicrobium sp.]|nr:GyrI-like domain-containing protein [Salinimicrobium sp.]